METLERLKAHLTRLPGVGEKSALRLALHILRSDQRLVDELAESLLDLKRKIHVCTVCCALSESGACSYCAHPRRAKDVVCVVEDIADLIAIERSHPLRWSYHVLHGVLSPLDGITPNDLKIRELLERLKTSTIKEVILATNPSVEGEATALYLAKILSPLQLKLTRIAQGIPP